MGCFSSETQQATIRSVGNRYFILSVVVAALFAASFSLFLGLQQSVWFDEAYSILLAEHSWGEIVRLTAADVHPPVYYWLLKIWMMLFGSSEGVLRSMSALFLGVSTFMAGLLLRKLFGGRTALLALPFIVFAPFLLRYGFEIRMYSFVSLIGIAATYFLVLAVEESKRKKRWLLFAIYASLVALGVYTLYFVALIWIAHVAWLAWLVYSERRYHLIAPGILAYVAAFLAFLPWLPVFLGKTGGDSLSPVTSELGPENLYGMLTFLFLYQPSWNTHFLVVLAAIFILMSVPYLAWLAYKNATKIERRSLVLLGAYFLVPVLILVVVTHFKPIYLERYIAHFAVAAYMGLGVITALSIRTGNKYAKIVGGALVTILLIGCASLTQYGNYNFQRIHKPSVKYAAEQLTGCKHGAVIFADGPQVAMELMYYQTECPVYFFNETLEMGGGFAMLSGSPLRVANASELPEVSEVLHVYYNKPKNTPPTSFTKESVKTKEKLSVAVYRAANR